MPLDTADYIIIGAGSAGCILAERLSADRQTSVAVLEAGGPDSSPLVSLPLGYGKLISAAKYTWQFETEADAGLNGRKAAWPRGRVLGGSGSINALVYCRGLPRDFEDWVASGAQGWSWQDVAPVFARLETLVSPEGRKAGTGPIHVQNVSDQIHSLTRHFFKALEEVGLPRSKDFAAMQREGFGAYHLNTRDGRRCSSARAFLHPALERTNVQLRVNTQVRRILVSGTTATGVELTGGEILTARREVLLCAGAIGSPQLLQVSGIGPGPLLREHGLPVVLENTHVGGILQDHLAASFTFRAREHSLNADLRPLTGQACAALRYALTRKGPLALSVNQCGGFLKSRPALEHPDQQLYLNPVSYRLTDRNGRLTPELDPFNGFVISAQPTRPTSRGRIDIKSADSTVPPRICANSLATDEDRAAVIDGGRLCQKIMASRAMRAVVETSEAPHLETLDDPGLLADFQERAKTVYHPVSTCRMGRDRTDSVLDSRLKVHGMKGLRVVDASAFPNITSGNTNAPAMMLALKGADMILEDRKADA